MTILSVEVNDAATLASLQRVERFTGNPQSFLERFGDYKLAVIDKQFETETNPRGEKWAPLSPFTVEQKIREGKILKILQRTGGTRASASYQVKGQSLVISMGGFAAANQFPENDRTPAREILGVNTTDGEVAQELAAAEIELRAEGGSNQAN